MLEFFFFELSSSAKLESQEIRLNTNNIFFLYEQYLCSFFKAL